MKTLGGNMYEFIYLLLAAVAVFIIWSNSKKV